MDKKLFWFDCETTGLNEFKNDIIQLAFIMEINNQVVERGQIKMQPLNYDDDVIGGAISPGALKIHGITIQDMKQYPTQADGFIFLQKLLEKHVDKYNKKDKFTPAGWNVNFDMKFLQGLFKKQGCKYFGSYFDYHYLDPMVVLNYLRFYGRLTTTNAKLGTAAEHFGVELKAHDAMSDIETTREISRKLNNFFITGI